MDDCILPRLDNGVADVVHHVVSTVIGCLQSLESRPFPMDGVLQAVVYVVQFFLERIDFIQQIVKPNRLAADFLKQSVKLLHILFQLLSGGIIGKPRVVAIRPLP